MEAHAKLNGSVTQKNNFVWGAALTLAWKSLCKEVLKQPLKINSDDKKVKAIAENYNNSPCDFSMLSEDCYYAKTGFGNKTVQLINKQMAKKFPHKTTAKVEENLPDDGIISYAYFFKKLLFEHPFDKKEVRFNNKLVSGFTAKHPEQKEQILINEFNDGDNFMVELKTKMTKDHIFLFKTTKDFTPEQILDKVHSTKTSKVSLGFDEVFEMPKIEIKHKRTVQQLVGVFLANQKFKQYYFSEIYQVINLDLDQKGVKVQNQGVVKLLRCGMPLESRRLVLDKPFWIIMRQQNKYPYFVAHISNIESKQQQN